MSDIPKVQNLFKSVLTDLFQLEGLIESHSDDLQLQIENQNRLLEIYSKTAGRDEFFVTAKIDEAIIGIIGFGKSNRIISSNLNFDLSEFVEIKSAYILPEYQNLGIGKNLLVSIFQELRKRDIRKYCFDCGYKSSQKIWTHLFGPPSVILIDYYGKKNHHYIWIRELGR